MSDAGISPETDESICPLPKTHARLEQAHRAWHGVENAYPDGDAFVFALNTAVQTFRNVTFILQTEMGTAIPEADAWYGPWQEAMKADKVMKWLHDARTRVVHQGDLETHSTARVSVISNWFSPIKIATLEVPPFIGPQQIATEVSTTLHLPEDVQKGGVLEVERQWVESGLDDVELLEALSHCYSVLSAIVTDAHAQCGSRMVSGVATEDGERELAADHLAGRLPCMVVTKSRRTAHLHLVTGEILAYGERRLNFTHGSGDDGADHYGIRGILDAHRSDDVEPDEAFLATARTWVEIGKRMLVEDGSHGTNAFLFTPNGVGSGILLDPADQQDKYLLMERLANRVMLEGADKLIFVAETWYLPADTPLERGQRPAEHPDRLEGLHVVALNAKGPEVSRQWLTPFTRDSNGAIALGDTEESPAGLVDFLFPVLIAWARMWPYDNDSGNQSNGAEE